MRRIFSALFLLGLVFSPLISTVSGQNTADKSALNFNNLRGNWELVYGNSYGYSFRFSKNYRAVVILYLNNNSIIFRGIYTIEDAGTLRINVSEMKREEKVKDLNIKSGFLKVKSSYFIFKSRIINAKTRKLELRPVEIYIDGSDSEGYFEPLIELDYTGR